MRHSVLVHAALLVTSLAVRNARADDAKGAPRALPSVRGDSAENDGDDARAERLFDAGLTAADAGNWRVALDRFQESQRHDPAPGTLLNIGRCREKLGLLAEAILAFEEVTMELPRTDERAQYAKGRISALEARVGRLKLSVPSDLRDVHVFLDGEEVPDGALQHTLPVNPGQREIAMTATGRSREVVRLIVKAGDQAELALGTQAQTQAQAQAQTPPEPASNEARHSELSTQRMLAYGSLGLGAASLVGSAITGLLAIDRRDTMEANCQGQRCNAEGVAASQSGSDFATVSTVTFGAGLAFLGAGAALFYFDDESGERRVGLTTTIDSVQVVVGGSL